jgi:hypothetical protein
MLVSDLHAKQLTDRGAKLTAHQLPSLVENQRHVDGRSSDSQASNCRAFSLEFSNRLEKTGNGNRNGQIDSAWSQRRGRPGFAPEFPVHRPPSVGQSVTNDAIRFKASNLSDGVAGVKQAAAVAWTIRVS